MHGGGLHHGGKGICDTARASSQFQYLCSRFRRYYEEFKDGLDDARDFLDTHMSDGAPFGGKCAETRWTEAQICRNFRDQ